ncbi:retrovirus-related pol polyprotein from transposon TNT 1-94 [Tanacetum coccineum]|uniref:Retrovirus-related pol polyprotein from transposon TNT 1-94 n=1 Tax=Tanacetum coccineum TaxID=301880 RepID=A0ABQ4YA41_9ASTR
MKSGIKTLNTVGQNFSKAAVSVNTARPINTAYPRPTENSARTASNVLNRAHSHVRRPFNNSTTNKNSNLKEKVNTIKGNVTTARPKAVVSDNKGNEANAVKGLSMLGLETKSKDPSLTKGVMTHECSTHNWKQFLLSNYEEIIVDLCALEEIPKEEESLVKVNHTGTKENIDASQDGKKIVPDQKYILLPLLTSNPLLSKSLKDSLNDGFKPLGEGEKINSEHQENQDSKVPNTQEPRLNQDAADIENNVVDENIVYGCIDDPNIPNLEEIVYSNDDDEEVGAEAYMNNLAIKNVYRNKKDDRGIMVRNKARLVAQGYTQEVGINYDEVFSPVARIEAIRLFLAYASFMGFIVYQMDVKSAFVYGTIEEEVYVCQPPSFEDPQFPDKVYKQKDDGIFISQDKYMVNILKKFKFATVKTASTPTETNKALLKDEEAADVDIYLYRSMIRSLMYLTASRPDIMFAVCACVRFQVTPKVPHLHAVKRIFRYLKGQPKLGLWYPRDSEFDLEAFSDSDYAASLDRKFVKTKELLIIF